MIGILMGITMPFLWVGTLASLAAPRIVNGAIGPVKNSNSISVTDFGAKGDGITDCTTAFQSALNAASKSGAGTVMVPSGNFIIKGRIQMPTGTSLIGTWHYNPSHTGLRDAGEAKPTEGGSTLLIEPAQAESYDPLAKETSGEASINLNSNCTLEGFVVYYPTQKTQSDPTPFPYSVAMRGNNGLVKNIELLNSYDGLDATHCARFLIRNVDGQPLHRGVVVDAIYDIGRIENVHFNPWFSYQTPVFDWEMKHGIAFVFGRSDWQYCENTFCFGYHVGYQFVATKNGTCNGNFMGIGADNCNHAVEIAQCAPYGLEITNGEFTSFKGALPTEVLVQPSNTGVARFMNCSFWGPSHQIARIEGKGTIAFNGCDFVEWNADQSGVAAISALGGTVMVTGCNFLGKGVQVKTGPDLKQSVIANNVGPG